jgi:protein O-GlcNAc transferase
MHCLRLVPGHAGAEGQVGFALMALGRPKEALAHFDRALQVVADDADVIHARGNALLALGLVEDAISSFRRALALCPGVAEAHYNLANVLIDQGRYEEGLSAFGRALEIRPAYPEALYNLGGALMDLRRHEDAAIVLKRLIRHAPDHRYAFGMFFHCRQHCCDWVGDHGDLNSYVRDLEDQPARDMPLSFLAVSADPALQLRCARAYTDGKFPATTPLWSGRCDRHDRVRIAYVSADFRQHPLSYLLAGVFEAHDREHFETFAIALRPLDASPMGRRLESAFDRFIDVSRMDDPAVATLMRDLEIDIAVDLTGYTEHNRTAIFAHRPAPVQVNYLGFPGTMGAAYIDYIIADEFVIPEPARRHYAEQVVYLPDCFQGNDRKREISQRTPSRAEVGLPESGMVFCAFNNVAKFTPVVFDVWMRLLKSIPGSVLWCAADAGYVRRNLSAEAARRGVAPERLVFAPRIAYADHLARLRLADLFLDTLPFNAGTTASDALWAGLPVLTCAGEAFAARMAGSLLTAVGLPELVTCSLEEYEALALKLATTPELLADLRSRLARNRDATPLFDTVRFCRHLEAAYRGMWDRQRRGDAPAPIKVPAALERTGV